MSAKRPDRVPENCSCDTRKEVRLEEEVEELYEHAAVFERWYEEEKVKSSELRQQLAIAERRLEIAEQALGKYADKQQWHSANWSLDLRWFGPKEQRDCNGWEPAANALAEMEEVK